MDDVKRAVFVALIIIFAAEIFIEKRAHRLKSGVLLWVEKFSN